MAVLLYQNQGKEIRYELCDGTISIGRGSGNSMRLHPLSVSREHALIRVEGDAFVLTDVGSKCGTFVNGIRLAGPVKLNHNDQIVFGETSARFLDGSDSTDLNVFCAKDSRSILSESSSGNGSGSKEILVAVLEIITSLAGNVNPDELLQRILVALFDIFKFADRGCIHLKDNRTGELVQRARKHRQEGLDESVRPSRTVLDRVMKQKKGVLSTNVATDPEVNKVDSIRGMHIRSLMCVPLLSLDNEPIGAISIDSSSESGQFTNQDLDILLAVACQAAQAYEKARLIAIDLEKQKQDDEMRLAKNVQNGILPKQLPKVPGYEFFASYDAAQAVGGDYYDVFELVDGRICISFGDVAGKGLPGALIMMRTQSCVRVTMKHVNDVETAIRAINTYMCDSPIEGRFITYLLAILDPQTHELTLSNGGHPSPLIRHADGRNESFDQDFAGPPIGVVDDFPYQSETKTLNPGDLVLFVTDGVEDAMNPAGELYGQDRMLEFLKQDHPSAKELGRSLLSAVRRHASGRAQNDDITILAFGRTGDPLMPSSPHSENFP